VILIRHIKQLSWAISEAERWTGSKTGSQDDPYAEAYRTEIKKAREALRFVRQARRALRRALRRSLADGGAQ
jgi:hypothetical protein